MGRTLVLRVICNIKQCAIVIWIIKVESAFRCFFHKRMISPLPGDQMMSPDICIWIELA